MHRLVSTITWALALAWTSFAVAGCGNDGGGSPDGGGGSGGSGGSGATGGAGGSGQPTDGAVIDTGFVGCVAKDAGIQCPSPATTYAKVQPIFQARCVNVCHNDMTPDPNNNNMPIWGFKDYDHVVTWQDTIRDSMYGCSMPPAGSGVPLTIEERRAIIEFISCKLPK